MSETEKESYDIDTLFEDAFECKQKDPYVSCIFWGVPESGKTFSALTFPGPIDFIDLDGGLDANLKYLKDKEGNPTKEVRRFRCVSLEDDKENLDDPEKYDGFKVDPLNTLRNFDKACTVLQQKEGGTIVVDTMTAYNDWLKMLFESRIPKDVTPDGKEYVDQYKWKYVNQKWLWTWEKLKNVKCNLVVIAKSKDQYQKRELTGNIEPDLRANTGFQTSIKVEFTKEITQTPDNKVTVKRIAKFDKFRGNKFGTLRAVEDLTYDKIMAILKEEEFA